MFDVRKMPEMMMRDVTTSSPSIIRVLIVVTLVIPAVFVVSPKTDDFLSSMPEDLKQLAAYDGADDKASMREGTCFLTTRTGGFEAFDPEICLSRDPGRKNILLIGDSHGAQLYEALRLTQDAHILQANASGCLPLQDAMGDRRCRDLWTYLTDEFLPEQHFDAIIMAGRWKSGAAQAAFATAEDLSAHADRVIVIGPNMEYPLALPRMLAQENAEANFLQMDAKQSPLPRQIDRDFRAAAPEGSKVTYLSFFETLCETECPLFSSVGDPALYDENHLTVSMAIDFVLAGGPLGAPGMRKMSALSVEEVLP